MRRTLLYLTCAMACLLCRVLLSAGSPERTPPRGAEDVRQPRIVVLNISGSDALPYDAGRVRFIAGSKDTGGANAVVELTELPGYTTAWHRHNNCEESFYVLEGVLTIRIADATHELPAGSYVLIPRGTPHGQGNFSANPLRLLTTFAPGGFEEFFEDRVELYRLVKPGDASFQARFDELRRKHSRWVEILGTWKPGR
jgi:quercetin dioxygenase-like cupin family protein